MDRRLGWEIERIILVVIILMGLADFFNLLPPFFTYIHELTDWIAVCYIVYAVSPTDLFFGTRDAAIDIGIVLSFVLLSVKELIANAIVSIPQLVANAGNFVVYSVSNATTGIPVNVTTAELNGFTLFQAVPRGAEIAAKLATHFTMAQQQLTVIFIDGTSQAAVTATPTGLNGMMLMFYNTLNQNSAMIQFGTLLLGTVLLLLLCAYAVYKLQVKRPSILAMVKEEGSARPGRVVWLFILLMAFYIMVFNLLFEWIALAIDAPLLIASILVVGFLFILRHAWRSGDNALEAVEEGSEDFFKRALEMLKDSKTVLLIICGLLVLHLLSDVANFLVPSIIPSYQSFYSGTLGNMPTIYSMVASSLTGVMATDAAMVLAYALSIAGTVFLLFLPGVIWYKIYKLRSTASHEHLPDWRGWQVGIIMACILASLLLPVYSLAGLRGGEYIGVNIGVLPITPERATAIPLVLSVAIGVFALCMILGLIHDWARRLLMLGPFAAALGFFGIYVYYYFTSAFVYYAKVIVGLLQSGSPMLYAVVPTLFVMFGLTIIFFITGFGSFLYEMWRD